MDGGSGSGCGCCSCGCLGCLAPIVAVILVIMLIFGFFMPMNHNFDSMYPDYYDEYYPDLNDGTGFPTDKGTIQPVYKLAETTTVTYAAF